MPKTIEAWKIKLKKMNDDKVLHDYRICPECLKKDGKLFEVFEEGGFLVCSNCEKKYYNG